MPFFRRVSRQWGEGKRSWWSHARWLGENWLATRNERSDWKGRSFDRLERRLLKLWIDLFSIRKFAIWIVDFELLYTLYYCYGNGYSWIFKTMFHDVLRINIYAGTTSWVLLKAELFHRLEQARTIATFVRDFSNTFVSTPPRHYAKRSFVANVLVPSA